MSAGLGMPAAACCPDEPDGPEAQEQRLRRAGVSDPACIAAGTQLHPSPAASTGSREKVTGSDMEAYITGEGATAILVVHDVFGFFAENTFAFSDHLAESGFLACFVDFFRGGGVPVDGWSMPTNFVSALPPPPTHPRAARPPRPHAVLPYSATRTT